MAKLLQAAAATVIILTVWGSDVWAQSFKSNLPKCKGEYSKSWNNCYGKQKFINGSYEGEFKDALYNGKGIFKLDSGQKYVGSFKDMLKNGQGTLTWADGTEFRGSWKNNELDGFGTFLYKVGENYAGYTGFWKNGAYDGLGIKITSDGNRYEGLWSNGSLVRSEQVYFPEDWKFIKDKIASRAAYNSDNLKSGVNQNNLPSCPSYNLSKKTDVGPNGRTGEWSNCWGRYRVELAKELKGDVLEGEWRNGHLHGQGTYTHVNGDKYVGSFKDGKFHGEGAFIFANGDKYEGEFKNEQWHGKGILTFANGDKYVGEHKEYKRHGKGTYYYANGSKYVGEYIDGKRHGLGIQTLASGTWYYGEWKEDSMWGQGVITLSDGAQSEGVWENGNFVREAKVNLPALDSNSFINTERWDLKREQAKGTQRINLQINTTTPAADGAYTISIRTNADTASLKLNGEELGGKSDGSYSVSRVARAGQDTKIEIIAKDVYGNTEAKTITVSRPLADSKPLVAALNPAQVKRQPERDAVAIIIGIADYKNLPRADYANDDARVFYDYAIRALGVKPENIKLLVDADADEVGIYRAFKTWLPSRVRSNTDVYVYYSGHGLPTADGQGLYVLPQRADRDFIDKTAITQAEINAAIQAAKPKSVTVFLDACYSGQARTGETLLASARPVTLKAETAAFPDGFTVITASRGDQISSSSPELKHGIFSYYLMRGMEGDADANRDGRITAGEMQAYLAENVSRQAGMMNRRQEPQLIGDANRVLVGR
ncbi:MAG: caspase family protein [Burkholderiaceae bacterium]